MTETTQLDITPQFYEKLIIKLVFHNQEMRDKIYPYLDPKYFDEDFKNQRIVKTLVDYMADKDAFPNNTEMLIALKDKEIHEEFKNILAIDDKEYITGFILEEVEEFFKKKLLFHAAESLMDTIKHKEADTAGEVPELISNALAFGFKSEIGTDFLEDEEKIYNSIHNKDKVLKTNLNFIDKGLDGGLHEKTLTLLMLSTNSGKTHLQVAIGANILLQNKNVLFITFEDAEEKISNRFIQNIFSVAAPDLRVLSKEKFHDKFVKLKATVNNKLIIKEYPEGSISAFHIKQLLKDLKIKKSFEPDIVFIDYIGCMVPNGKPNANINSYETLKQIAGQVRSLAMTHSIPIVSAMQTNRSGINSKEVNGLDKASDSVGQAFKADAIFSGRQTPEMKAAGLMELALVKTRFPGGKRTFNVNIDTEKQQVTNISEDDEGCVSEDSETKNVDMSVVNKYKSLKPSFDKNNKDQEILITFD